MAKIKHKHEKIQKPCTNCFEPVYLKFNYSYVDNDATKLNPQYKAKIFDRMLELSENTFLVIFSKGRESAFEYVSQNDIGIRKCIPTDFQTRFPDEAKKKFAIMRIYPNNNPIVGRLIGIIIKNVFYVFFIDIGGKLYKH